MTHHLGHHNDNRRARSTGNLWLQGRQVRCVVPSVQFSRLILAVLMAAILLTGTPIADRCQAQRPARVLNAQPPVAAAPGQSADDLLILELFQKHAQSAQEGASQAELDKINQQIEQVWDRIQKRMLTDPAVDMQSLPTAPPSRTRPTAARPAVPAAPKISNIKSYPALPPDFAAGAVPGPNTISSAERLAQRLSDQLAQAVEAGAPPEEILSLAQQIEQVTGALHNLAAANADPNADPNDTLAGDFQDDGIAGLATEQDADAEDDQDADVEDDQDADVGGDQDADAEDDQNADSEDDQDADDSDTPTAPTAEELAEDIRRAVESAQIPTRPAEIMNGPPPPKPAASGVPSPDDIVKLNTTNNLLDINILIEIVGKELQFTFLYDNTTGVSGQVKLQQYGQIRRRDLLPLLESMLSFQKLTMIREDPFIRIVKRDESLKKTYPRLVVGPNTPALGPGDQVISQIVAIEHVKIEDVKNLLNQFTDPSVMVPIANTNYLIITEYARRLPRLLEMIELIDQPGPPKTLVSFELQYVQTKDISTQLDSLLKSLLAEGLMDTGTAATATQPAAKPAQPAPRSRRRAAARRKPAKQPAKKVITAGPIVHVDERANRFLVIGTEEQLEQVANLLDLLDVDQPGLDIRLVPFEITHVQATDIKPQLAELIDALAQQAGAPLVTAQSPTAVGDKKRPAPAKPSAAKPTGKGPYMLVDERTNRLFVVGTPDQIDQVGELLALLDIEKPGPPIKLEPVKVTHVNAVDVVSQLADLIRALADQTSETDRATTPTPAAEAKARRSARLARSTRTAQSPGDTTVGPYMLADERTNRLLVVGTDEQIGQVIELLGLLDIPPYEYGQAVIHVYQPQYVDAAEALKIMDQLGITKTEPLRPREQARRGPERARTATTTEAQGLLAEQEFDIRVAVQESLNKMFILATEPQHHDISELLVHIDQEPNDAVGAIQIYFLENREPEIVADMLIDLLDSDTTDVQSKTTIPGKEGAPKIYALDDIYAVAVRGSKKQHEDIQNIIAKLDKRLPEVLVEAILVQVNTSDSLDLGVTLQDTRSIGGSRNISGSSPFNIGTIAQTGSMVTSTGGAVLAYMSDDLVYATLEALQEQGDAKIVSKPRILVADNEEGTMSNTRSEPTTTTTFQTGSDVPIRDFKSYVDAGTTLTITPHISEGDFLRLEITLDVDSFDGEGSGDIPPPKSSNNLSTVVSVPDAKTIVLGGLTTQTNAIDVRKVPFLGDIPLIGAAFRSVSRSTNHGLLYVFVRANIVRSDTPETVQFEDLDRISAPYRDRLRQSENSYQHQTVIPGIPDQRKSTPSALDD